VSLLGDAARRGANRRRGDSQVTSSRSAAGDAGVIGSCIKSVIDPAPDVRCAPTAARKRTCRASDALPSKVKREKNAEVRHRDTPSGNVFFVSRTDAMGAGEMTDDMDMKSV